MWKLFLNHDLILGTGNRYNRYLNTAVHGSAQVNSCLSSQSEIDTFLFSFICQNQIIRTHSATALSFGSVWQISRFDSLSAVSRFRVKSFLVGSATSIRCTMAPVWSPECVLTWPKSHTKVENSPGFHPNGINTAHVKALLNLSC